MPSRSCLFWSIFAFCLFAANAALTVSSRILVIATDAASAKTAATGLRGYGIPYQTVIITSKSDTLPALSTSPTVGNFGGILVTDDILSSSQLDTIHSYQTAFNVRLVQWDASPASTYGTKWAVSQTGCCNSGEQLVSLTDTSAFSTAGLRIDAGVSTENLWHNPATISNSSIAVQIATFAAAGSFKTNTTAAVINTIETREQMVWFMPFELDWSQTSNYLQHASIHWVTRGLYLGYRRVQLNTQVDDMHLTTAIFSPSGSLFRMRPGDMEAHKTWTGTINAKMNPGSSYFIELGHNGNGNIDNSSDVSDKLCVPDGITYVSTPFTSTNEWIKPLGTGVDCWPSTPTSFVWSSDCIALDQLEQWFAKTDNLDAFAHVSHTFTHESLDNATYADANKEITFNQVWLNNTGISGAAKFSPKSLIPPAITGLHNGDAIQAWADNGITAACGDNTRSALLNTDNEYWPLITTVTANGYDGFPVVPRWATNIYYNCDTTSCISAQYTDTSNTPFQSILQMEQATNVMHLLSLRQDPFMFHQANMRQIDVSNTTLLDETNQKLSLLQIWVETIVAEMVRLTTWPIISKKFDDMAVDFLNRKMRDGCNPDMWYNFDTTGTNIISVTVSASGSSCGALIPITFPGPVTSQGTATAEQVGSDPLTLWVNWAGQSQTFTLQTPIPTL